MLFERAKAAQHWDLPGDMIRQLEPATTVQTPALQAIDEALVDLLNTPDGRLIITMPPQEGKSTRVAQVFPVWALTKNPDTRVITASYGQDLANRNGKAIRALINKHQDALGLSISSDNGAARDWTIAGHVGGVYSAGIGAGMTGRPCDLMVVDDPIKDPKEADSETYRQNNWDWWETVASTRLAPGAPAVVILTRWHHDDLAGRLIAAGGWKVLNIPAQADHDPNKGEADVLGREPGEYMLSARGRSVEQWEAIRKQKGSRAWAALYQGRPSVDVGNLFPRDKWARYATPMWIDRADGSRFVLGVADADTELIQSWDLAFKDTKSSDYVVGQVWLRRGPTAYLLDQVRGRWDFTTTCEKIRALTARWPQATLKLVEDKANGPAVLNALRATVGGLVPVEPEGSKYARATAITPLQEAGNLVLPDVELAPWVDDLIEEAAAFPTGAHDDQVDAMSQAGHRLLLVPILDETPQAAEELLGAEEFYPAWAANDY